MGFGSNPPINKVGFTITASISPFFTASKTIFSASFLVAA